MKAPRHLGRRYSHGTAFRQALDGYWGQNGTRVGPDERTTLGACPACRSKGITGSDTERYPLIIVEAESGWDLSASCGCTERAILEALARPGVRRLRVRPAAEVRARPVGWLWRDLIPLGKVTVLAGSPGLGKSMLTARLAGMVTTGTASGDLEGPVDVLLASAEDDPEDTIKPRLLAAEADLERAKLIDLRENGPDGLPVDGLVQLPRDAVEIEAAVVETGARLVVLDPVVAFLDADHSAYREQDVRAALAPLKRLAEETGCAVVVVMHLNKGDGARPAPPDRQLGGVHGARAVGALARPRPRE